MWAFAGGKQQLWSFKIQWPWVFIVSWSSHFKVIKRFLQSQASPPETWLQLIAPTTYRDPPIHWWWGVFLSNTKTSLFVSRWWGRYNKIYFYDPVELWGSCLHSYIKSCDMFLLVQTGLCLTDTTSTDPHRFHFHRQTSEVLNVFIC